MSSEECSEGGPGGRHRCSRRWLLVRLGSVAGGTIVGAACGSADTSGCGPQFDGLGDRKAGPAPAGMSLHRITVDDDDLVSVDAKPRLAGLPSGSQLVRHEAPGSH